MTDKEKNQRDIKILQGIDKKFQDAIMRDIVESSEGGVRWNDIVGLGEAKETLKEMAIFPLLRPDLFVGLRAPPRGLLLFGPPGTGKSMLAKAVANESSASYFNIHASTLTNKFLGDSEKMVKALFGIARIKQPSVIFIDEIDSILRKRGDSEHEAVTRLKNEFFEQMDGVASSGDENLVVIGATNRPHALDEAALRRLAKHVYIPLPEKSSRVEMISNLLEKVPHNLSRKQVTQVADKTAGYSGSDIFQLVSEAARLPLRELGENDILTVKASAIRDVSAADFEKALVKIRASVSQDTVKDLEKWSSHFGTNA